MDQESIKTLYRRYLDNELTREELEAFLDYIETPEGEQQVAAYLDVSWREMYDRDVVRLPVRRRFAWVAAASVLAAVISVSYLFFSPAKISDKPVTHAEHLIVSDVIPGGNKATLTLMDGSKVVLDSMENGRVAKQGNISITKAKDGQLSYQVLSSNNGGRPVRYNLLSTPRGGQYHVVLSDGTKVWLNAASSIRFPTSFEGGERRIELTGEAYFEVQSNPDVRFVVSAGGASVEVLGTHFNISAYTDERSIVTSLLEGSLRVVHDASTRIIKPGQQASINREISNSLKIENKNVQNTVAWKDGYFQFENLTIQEIMRQLSRWYDIDVRYEGKPPAGHYVGKPSRSLSLSEILEIIEYSGVKITLTNRTLIVKG